MTSVTLIGARLHTRTHGYDLRLEEGRFRLKISRKFFSVRARKIQTELSTGVGVGG